MSTDTDNKLAGLAAGFTLGFGVLTVWEAVKQTRACSNPRRSHYIYMIWGEIVANLAIGIIAWLLLDGTLVPSVPVLFCALVCWVFEIQLLMQIIINRTAVIVDDHRLMAKIKWGTAGLITLVNIAVFCIWIPTHSTPPPSPIFAQINQYWDRTSKVIILLVDAGLNYYFIRSVNKRLVKYHGLTKYKPLVTFNTRLMVISISMDIMIIGLMHLQNPLVYTQFHPVAYMVKLNIEMTMASLIKKIAQATVYERDAAGNLHLNRYTDTMEGNRKSFGLGTGTGGVARPGAVFKSGSAAGTGSGAGARNGNWASATAKQPRSQITITELEDETENETDTSMYPCPDRDRSGIRKTTEVRVRHEDINALDKDAEMGMVTDSDVDGMVCYVDERGVHERERAGVVRWRSEDELPLKP